MKTTEPVSAYASELFSSAQGEGIQVGRRQLFIRFCDCHRACRYCDTPVARTPCLNIETKPGSGETVCEPNPVSLDRLLEWTERLNRAEFAHADLFITGGEPLLQAGFLERFLPEARRQTRLPVHLETSGDLPDAFQQIAPWVDHVLMDIKLPSVTGEPATWSAHREFLDRIAERNLSATIKLVVCAETEKDDLSTAIELIKATDGESSVILQPLTRISGGNAAPPTAVQILSWQSEMTLALGRAVRIIPQCHKLMGLL